MRLRRRSRNFDSMRLVRSLSVRASLGFVGNKWGANGRSCARFYCFLTGCGMSMVAMAGEQNNSSDMYSIGVPIFPDDRSFEIDAKKMHGADSAITAGMYFSTSNQRNSSRSSSGSFESSDRTKEESRFLELLAGWRKYISRSEVRVFWEASGSVFYGEAKATGAGCATLCSSSESTFRSQGFTVAVALGGEYYLNERFSIEASTGFVQDFTQSRGRSNSSSAFPSSSNRDKSYVNSLGTYVSGLRVNYYW